MAIAQGSSELNISLVVHETDREKAVRAVHDEFHGA
jgi:aspartokinase